MWSYRGHFKNLMQYAVEPILMATLLITANLLLGQNKSPNSHVLI